MAGSSSKCSLYTSVIHQSGFDCIRMIQRGQKCRCEYVDIQWIILIYVIRVSLLFVLIKPDSFSVSNLTIILVYIGTLMLRSSSMKPFTIHQRYSLAFSLGMNTQSVPPVHTSTYFTCEHYGYYFRVSLISNAIFWPQCSSVVEAHLRPAHAVS